MAADREKAPQPPVLVIGRTGQIAASLRAISDDEMPFLCLGRREGLDITDADSLRVVLDGRRPDLVVNAAAYTSVDRAEAEPDAAFAVNAQGPATLARLCAERDIPIIHLSTDYVFDGMKGEPYVEDDLISPVNTYGASKAAGETALRDITHRYVILRTSWLYFMKTMLRLAQTREEISVVADQRGCPTAAHDVAAAIRTIAFQLREGGGTFGVFHLAGAEAATWFDFANGIVDLAGAGVDRRLRILPIATAEYRAAALRPPDSRLGCGKVAGAYGLALPSWRKSLERVLAQPLADMETKG